MSRKITDDSFPLCQQAKETVCTSFKDCEFAKKTDLQVCGVYTLRYSSTRNSEFVENNSFKPCSQLCESNLEKMDFQKEERNLHKVFELNNEG